MTKTRKLKADIWEDGLTALAFQPSPRISPGLGPQGKPICSPLRMQTHFRVPRHLATVVVWGEQELREWSAKGTAGQGGGKSKENMLRVVEDIPSHRLSCPLLPRRHEQRLFQYSQTPLLCFLLAHSCHSFSNIRSDLLPDGATKANTWAPEKLKFTAC